jgi:DNA invertase Pin-like site-specific DNA recombinase
MEGVGVMSLRESTDMATAAGILIFPVFGALAEFEPELIREPTNAVLATARERRKTSGRKRTISPAQATAARELLTHPGATVLKVARAMKVLRTTLSRYLDEGRLEASTKAKAGDP